MATGRRREGGIDVVAVPVAVAVVIIVVIGVLVIAVVVGVAIDGAVASPLNGSLGVTVTREPLHVDLRDGELVRYVVGVLDAARLRESLAQGRLLPQYLRQGGGAVLAVARV